MEKTKFTMITAGDMFQTADGTICIKTNSDLGVPNVLALLKDNRGEYWETIIIRNNITVTPIAYAISLTTIDGKKRRVRG